MLTPSQIKKELSKFISEDYVDILFEALPMANLTEVGITNGDLKFSLLHNEYTDMELNPVKIQNMIQNNIDCKSVIIEMKHDYVNVHNPFLPKYAPIPKERTGTSTIYVTMKGVKTTMKKEPEVIRFDDENYKIIHEKRKNEPLSLDAKELRGKFEIKRIKKQNKKLSKISSDDTVDAFSYVLKAGLSEHKDKFFGRPISDSYAFRREYMNSPDDYIQVFVFAPNRRVFEMFLNDVNHLRENNNKTFKFIGSIKDLRGLKCDDYIIVNEPTREITNYLKNEARIGLYECLKMYCKYDGKFEHKEIHI